MNKKIILIGAGGHLNSCLEIIENNKKFKILGLVSKNKILNNFNYKIIGQDKDLSKLRKIADSAFICVGQITNLKKREEIYNKLKILKFNLPIFFSKNAYISKNSDINEGTIIMNHCTINRNVKISETNIINTSAIIEHDAFIGKHTHVSTGAIINGDVTIESNCFIGSGAIIREGVKIGRNSIIGAGIIIKKDIKSNSVIK